MKIVRVMRDSHRPVEVDVDGRTAALRSGERERALPVKYGRARIRSTALLQFPDVDGADLLVDGIRRASVVFLRNPRVGG